MLPFTDEYDDNAIAGWERHRASIVRLCATLVGDHAAAEDIAQETFLIAWRNQHKLYAPNLGQHWLAGIARKLCRNWLRAHRPERQNMSFETADGLSALDIADDFDLEHELERHELAELLDRALAMLPPETRTVLVGRYVQDASHADLATALGISDKAVSMRISRGKLLIKHLLHTALREEAIAFGLVIASTEHWQPTRIWCQKCAAHRLLVRIPAHPGTVSFRCPGCTPSAETSLANFRLANRTFNGMIGDLQRPRSMLNRTREWVWSYFRQALREHSVPCTNCGRRARLLPMPDNRASLLDEQVIVVCDWCGEMVSTSVLGMAAALPEAQRFWHQHERVRSTVRHEIEVGGHEAFVTRFESVSSAERLDIVLSRDGLRLLSIDGVPVKGEA